MIKYIVRGNKRSMIFIDLVRQNDALSNNMIYFNNIFKKQMSTKKTGSVSREEGSGEKFKSQEVFKWLSWLVVGAMVCSAPGFWKFRLYCQEVGYHVVDLGSSWWCAVGFLLAWVFRRGYYVGMRSCITGLVDQKYEGKEREKKTESLLKLSYDMVFYFTNTLVTLYLFRGQSWFPWCIAGEGSCEGIYEDYPNWPREKRPQMQAYFLFHLGAHVFSLVELPLFRWGDRKFYEWGLHHLVTVALLMFSLTCNQVTIGIVILFIHDASDAFLSAGRFYTGTNLKKSTLLLLFLGVSVVFMWIFGRLLAFPSCMIWQIYKNAPAPADDYYMIQYQYWFLFVMTVILLLMHIFWSYFLYNTLWKGMKEKSVVNNFDTQNKK